MYTAMPGTSNATIHTGVKKNGIQQPHHPPLCFDVRHSTAPLNRSNPQQQKNDLEIAKQPKYHNKLHGPSTHPPARKAHSTPPTTMLPFVNRSTPSLHHIATCPWRYSSTIKPLPQPTQKI